MNIIHHSNHEFIIDVSFRKNSFKQYRGITTVYPAAPSRILACDLHAQRYSV